MPLGLSFTIRGVNVARWFLSVVAGWSAALIAFGTVYVQGDLMGVMRFLRARGEMRRLIADGAGAAQIEVAQARALSIAQGFAAPELATRLIPLELLIGMLVGLGVWWLFGRRAGRALGGQERSDVQERMVLRLAHRKGGRFTLDDLSAQSPLTQAQAQAVTARMVEAGRLRHDGQGYALLTARTVRQP